MIGRAIASGARSLRSNLATPEDWLRELIPGGKTFSGPRVDEQSALRMAAVGACVRVVSEDIGKVPCIVYERTDIDSRDRAPYDSYAPALALCPNPEMSAFEYWETLTGYAMLWGRCTAYINKRRNGTVELWPLPPNRVEFVREKLTTGNPGGTVTPGKLIGVNVTLNSGEKRFLPWRNIVHMGTRGYDTETPISRHRQTIGAGLAREEFGGRFFGQGGTSGGFIVMPVEATPEQADRTEARYRADHEGLERSHLVGILEGGADWKEVGMPLRDAQYIEGQQWGVEEVCRIFRVPPHKVQHLLRSTFNNIEHQAIEYVVDTVSSYTIRHEQAHRIALYGTAKYGQVGERYPEFLLDALLRGDTKARYEAYALAVQWGWMSRAQVARRENLPAPDELDDYLYPMNMNIAGQEVEPVDEPVRALAALLSRGYHAGNGHDPSALPPTLPAS